MADHSITFRIGSVFTGEGFKKAEETVKTMNAEMKKGMSAAQQMSGFIGQLDTSSSKAATAMTGMLQAMMSMNATVIASQTAIIALNLATSDLISKYDDLKKKAEEVKASMEKSFNSALSDRMNSIKEDTSNLAENFERITKQANQFAAALEGVRNAEANGGVLQLQVEKLNELLEAHGDEQRANIEAAYNLKIAIQRSADSETEWLSKIDAAHQKLVDNENRIANIDSQIAVVSEERRSLEQTMLSAKRSGDEHWLEIQKQVASLYEQETSLEQKKLDAEAEMDVLRLEEKKTKQEAVNAQQKATIEIRNAEIAEKKLNEAKDARRLKEEAARDAAEMKAAADLEDAKSVESLADIQKRSVDAAKGLEAAQNEYARKLQEFNRLDLISFASRAFTGKDGLKGGCLPVDVQKGIQLKTADTQVDEAIRTGMVHTVKDADKLQRQAMREARNKISKNQAQQLAEAKRYKRLQEMNPKALCSSDREFMMKYEKIQKAAEKRAKELEESKKKLDEAKKVQEKTLQELQSVSKRLDGLGLK